MLGGKRGEEKVVGVVGDNMKRVGNEYGWNMVICGKLRGGDLFDGVGERMKGGWRGKGVVFCFGGDECVRDGGYWLVVELEMED